MHGPPAHLVSLRRVHDEVDGDHAFGDQVVPEDLHSGQGRRVPDEEREQKHQHFGQRRGEQQQDRLLDVAVDHPPLLHGGHDQTFTERQQVTKQPGTVSTATPPTTLPSAGPAAAT
jgi:hypothetical protein